MQTHAHAPARLSGMVEGVIFHNEENGYTVFVLDIGDEVVTCTGYIADPREGETLEIEGRYVENPRYGRQLAVEHAVRSTPKTADGIERYLASGVIKGIGAKTARQIVARFGDATFDILENHPDKLARIKGITLERAVRYSEAFHAQHDQRQAVLFLQEYGVTPAGAVKIYKKYKDETVRLVRENPFRLADDIDGIGFKTADGIAHRMGIARDSAARISAGTRYILWEAAGDGHTFLPVSILVAKAAELLQCPPEIIENTLENMQINREIIREKCAITGDIRAFVPPLYHAELFVARQILALAAAFKTEPTPREKKSHEKALKAAEKSNSMQLSDSQKKAVQSALLQGVLIITGGPGTGKTTTINTIIGLLKAQKLSVTLAAPTGRAAKRMTEATGEEARTVHRLLEVEFISENSRRQRFKRDEENPLETDVIIVDEFSMVDILLARSLFAAVAQGTRLIIVGDMDQLPSVGAGNVLRDLIASGTLHVARLTEVFRQAQQSAIIVGAHEINAGNPPDFSDKQNDFFFIKRTSQPDVAATILNLVTTRLPAYANCTPAEIQVLSPTRRGALGVDGLNKLLQANLNPPARGKAEREYNQIIFREGDRVMQIKNNYDATWETVDDKGRRTDFGEGVYNGDMGVIHTIDEALGMTIIFDDGHRALYDFSRMDELAPAFAVTVHKAQGSEYPVVVLPIVSGPPMLLTRNLLYTAVTRAKSLCVLVGTHDVLHRMIANAHVSTRHTALATRLQAISCKFENETQM